MSKLFFAISAVALVLGCCVRTAIADDTARDPKVWKIMCIGDSITEGGSKFTSYRYPLDKMLKDIGFKFEFVGSRTSKKPIPLKHEGYSGWKIEKVAPKALACFKKTPADIVLIHGGHNHFEKDKPVAVIVESTLKLIKDLQAINPDVRIYVAQVIVSGKLPKYSYIPELNEALMKMVRYNFPASDKVVLVNVAKNFDWKTDAISDKVHPNAQGADKIAQAWFEALKSIVQPKK